MTLGRLQLEVEVMLSMALNTSQSVVLFVDYKTITSRVQPVM